MSSRWLKLEEAAEMLGTGAEGVLTLIRFRELPIALHSAQVLVWREAVEAKVRCSRKTHAELVLSLSKAKAPRSTTTGSLAPLDPGPGVPGDETAPTKKAERRPKAADIPPGRRSPGGQACREVRHG
jgi:hypothetical protein